MSKPLTWKSADLRSALERTSALARLVTVRQTWFEFGWRWLSGLAALFLLDVLFALPVPVRWLGLLGLVAYPVEIAVRVRKRVGAISYGEEHSARLMEEGHPELNNALINAVQFGRVIEGAEPEQAYLMRQEIARAEQAVEKAPLDDVAGREREHRARRILTGVAGTWIAMCVLFPGVVLTVFPRLFTPWLDNITPPFSLSKIDLNPKGAEIPYGGSLVVKIAVQGPVPENLNLTTRGQTGPPTDVPVESTEPGKFAVTLRDLKQDTWMVAIGGGARSGRYLIKVLMPPTAESLHATYKYAEYTQRPANTEQVGEQGIHAWHDTKVHFTVKANRELLSGQLVVDSPDAPSQHIQLLLDPKDRQSVVGDFSITATGTFHVSLTAADRQVNPDAAHGKVFMEPEQRPNVWFDEPEQSITVTPDMKVALAVGADDEIGISQVDLHRVIDGIADSQNSLYRGAPVKRTGARLTMDMADLGVRPGDEITYYADAFDSHPGKPNYAETDPYTIKVVSPEAFKKMLQDQRTNEELSREAADIKDALNSLAERQQDLADKMDKLAKELAANPGNAALKKQMADAQKEQRALQQEAAETAKKLADYAASPSGSPIESALKKKVGEAAQALAQAAGMPSGSSSNPGSAAAAEKRRAAAMKRAAGRADKTITKTIQNLEKVQPLFQDVDRFMDLLNRQGQLVLEARQYEQQISIDNVDRSKMAAIAAEQQKIKDDLRSLQNDFRRHAAEARADFPKAAASAVKIADEIDRRQIPTTMDAAHSQFLQEQGPGGFANSKKAFDQMNAMVSQCQAGQGTMKGELDIKLSRTLGQSGLGQSLGQNPGMGKGNGPSQGTGAGGTMADGTGSTANGSNNGSVAYTMNMRSLSNGSGGSTSHFHKHAPGEPAALSADRIEKLTDVERQPPKAGDSSLRGYPPEYRKLIRDYFLSVTKEQNR